MSFKRTAYRNGPGFGGVTQTQATEVTPYPRWGAGRLWSYLIWASPPLLNVTHAVHAYSLFSLPGLSLSTTSFKIQGIQRACPLCGLITVHSQEVPKTCKDLHGICELNPGEHRLDSHDLVLFNPTNLILFRLSWVHTFFPNGPGLQESPLWSGCTRTSQYSNRGMWHSERSTPTPLTLLSLRSLVSFGGHFWVSRWFWKPARHSDPSTPRAPSSFLRFSVPRGPGGSACASSRLVLPTNLHTPPHCQDSSR